MQPHHHWQWELGQDQSTFFPNLHCKARTSPPGPISPRPLPPNQSLVKLRSYDPHLAASCSLLISSLHQSSFGLNCRFRSFSSYNPSPKRKKIFWITLFNYDRIIPISTFQSKPSAIVVQAPHVTYIGLWKSHSHLQLLVDSWMENVSSNVPKQPSWN